VPSSPAGISVSNRAVIMLADELRHHRMKIGTRWRRLEAGHQALPTLAHLRKGESMPILHAASPSHHHRLPLPAGGLWNY
jgi:hypothetical protein